jgi:DNA-binding transcriptional LysR family regulator
MRRDHPSAGARLTRRLFETLDHITIASPYTGHRTVEHALSEHGIRLKAKLTVANYTSVPDVIAQTNLLVVAPSRVARAFAESHGLKSRELPIPVPVFSVRVHWSPCGKTTGVSGPAAQLCSEPPDFHLCSLVQIRFGETGDDSDSLSGRA